MTVAPEVRARFQHLQALEGALKFRRARAAEPCPECGPGGKCADHARDAGLIGEYESTARRLLHAGAGPVAVAAAAEGKAGS